MSDELRKALEHLAASWSENPSRDLRFAGRMIRSKLAADPSPAEAHMVVADNLHAERMEEAGLRDILEWIESYYGEAMQKVGCPCTKERKCPFHAALSASGEALLPAPPRQPAPREGGRGET